MRLIRTTSEEPELTSFPEEQIPEYAILSHVWEEEEVSFQHMQDPSGPSSRDLKNKKKGWSKIVQACKVARSESYDYIWIDTCCIDKSSSAELSEAINSMYRYYSEAAVCYVYLADLRSDLPRRSFSFGFRKCKWFTRGWTLQELIAPARVVFFAKDWEKFGTRASLQGILTHITKIPSEVLLSQAYPSNSSIAARMSWAAGRRTTRIEDRAYSLMGLFGVYMPPIYGEGEHAFIRLQEEILKVSDDHTIFAWNLPKSSSSQLEEPLDYSGILAASPDVFEGSGEYKPFGSDSQRPFSMTNMGLLVHLPLFPIVPVNDPEFLAVLNCTSKTSKRLAIYVRRSRHQHQYERARSDRLVEDDDIQAKCGKIKSLQPKELFFKAWDLPSHEHFSSYHSFSISLSGDQKLIMPVIYNVNDIFNEPVDGRPLAVEKITDTGDRSLGVFGLTSVGKVNEYAFLFIHDPSQQMFVVMVGKNSGGFWLDLQVSDPKTGLKLERIRQSYDTGKEHGDIPGKNLDRISKFLTDNVAILVEGRRQSQRKSDRRVYYINIRIVKNIDKIYSNITPAVLPTATRQYDFTVSLSSVIKAGFSRLETYPNHLWEECDSDTMHLFLDDVNTLGTLCFLHEQNQERHGFAITLGISNSTVRAAFISSAETEYKGAAKDICNSYIDGYLPYRAPTILGAALSSQSAIAHVHVMHNQYNVEIEVKPR